MVRWRWQNLFRCEMRSCREAEHNGQFSRWATRYPYDLGRTPGSSSGGTGPATAGVLRSPAQEAILTIDSIPGPLSWACGLISRCGIIPLGTVQNETGPITRTVEDAARMLDVMAGYDPDDPIIAVSVHARSLMEQGRSL